MTDPIIAAGYMTCRCGAVGFPLDAVWLGDDLILARYASSCDHLPESVRIICPSDLQPEGRCIGINASGTRCRRRSGTGQWCVQHSPQREPRS